MLDLMKLNNYGISKVLFYDPNTYDSLDSLFEDLELFNIVFASNGLFQLIKSELFVTISKINVPYSNKLLESLDDDYIYQTFPKPNKEYFDKIIDLFRYVSDKTKYELMVNLYFDKHEKEFIIDIVDQEVSGGTVKYKYNEEYENSERYVRYLQIHSHNTMTAHFSTTDNNDESNKLPCYYGVVGNLDKPIYSYQFRIWTGNKFKSIEITDVFEGFEISENLITVNEKEILDQIIEKSKNKMLEKSQFHKFSGFSKFGQSFLEEINEEDILEAF